MCEDKREKDMGSWRGEKEVRGEIHRIYTVVVHTVYKTVGGKEAASSSSDLIFSLLSSLVTAPSCILYKTGATGGGVAWGTVCD